MPWSSPATWTGGQLVAASDLNAQLRDNLLFLGGTTGVLPSLHATTFTIDSGGLTVTAGGVGIGSTPAAFMGLYVAPSTLTGTAQYGVYAQPVGSNAATATVSGVLAQPGTAAAAFTSAQVSGFRAATPVKGASSIITNAYGLLVDSITTGDTNNYGIFVGAPSAGTGVNEALHIAGGGFNIVGTYNFANAEIPNGATFIAQFGNVGGAGGPGTQAQHGWMAVQVAGVNSWIPVWR